MDNFWQRVRRLEGRSIRTVTSCGLRIDAVTDSAVTITIASTGNTRAIPRERLERGWALKRGAELLRPSTVRREGVSNFNPAYVAAIVNAVAAEA